MSGSRGLFWLVALAAVVGVLGCGGGGGGSTPAPAGGRVQGQVYLADAATPGGVAAVGAAVRVQGTALRATTDATGGFTLANVPTGAQHLLISFSGYATADVPVTVQAGRTVQATNTVLNPADRQWTVMVFVNADNDLEPFAIRDLNEMEAVPDSDAVTILAQVDRTPGYDASNGNWTDTRRLRIQHDTDTATVTSPVVQSLGEVDMGQPDAAQAFLSWGMQQYPAEHYAFVFWNHGAGWRLAPEGTALTRGISYDFTSGTHIRTVDVPAALAADRPVDLVAFDACLMQMTEIAYEMRTVCDYVVAAEDNTPGDGYAYDGWLAPLVETPSLTPRDLGTIIARETVAYYDAYLPIITQSVVETAKLPAVVSAVDRLAGALRAVAGVYPTELANARKAADRYADPEFKDLAHYAALVRANINDAEVDAAADAVLAAVQSAVVAAYHGSEHPNAQGLSIYLPDPGGYAADAASYAGLALALDSQWDAWLGAQME